LETKKSVFDPKGCRARNLLRRNKAPSK
jgi:hypothetical protein